jgi:uncharacterized protein YjeT (DUF2065 family)
MFDFLEKNQSRIVGIGFVCIGVLTLFKGRIGLENTSYSITGISARIVGIFFIAIGVFVLFD